MGFEFTLENAIVKNSRIFTDNKGAFEDAKIVLKDSEINDTILLSNLDLQGFCSQVNNRKVCMQMSADEYVSIQQVLKKNSDRKAFVHALLQHLSSFGEGVVASLVANYIQR